MDNKPLTLAIVIPVFNEELYIGLCLDAIASQTVKPDEVIVVNNNSTDKTAEIASSYKFVQLLSESKQGRAYAQKRGFDSAKGQIIARIDADTRLDKDWVAKTSNVFTENPGIAAVTGQCRFYDFPLSGSAVVLQNFVYQTLQKYILGTEVLWGANMAIRSSAWKAVRHSCRFGNHLDEDIDLTMHLHKAGLRVKKFSSLKAGVSMQRGDLGLASTVKYLSTWPKTYWANGYRFRAVLIYLIKTLVIISGVPFYLRDSVGKRKRPSA